MLSPSSTARPRSGAVSSRAAASSTACSAATCGVRLFHNPERNPRASIVKPGTLDDTTWLKPVGHIWTKSAQSWVPIPKDTVNYEAQPPDLSRLIEAWQAQQARG